MHTMSMYLQYSILGLDCFDVLKAQINIATNQKTCITLVFIINNLLKLWCFDIKYECQYKFSQCDYWATERFEEPLFQWKQYIFKQGYGLVNWRKECWRKMDEVRAMNKIEAKLPQEKIDFINDVHQKELQYGKKIALESKDENEKKQLTDLAPLRVSLARKYAVKMRKMLMR